ncbi:kinase-like domain-containing protein [Suillus ampliporus]|nr:kinase-like domain-containing protein [Suillus ampliporus]
MTGPDRSTVYRPPPLSMTYRCPYHKPLSNNNVAVSPHLQGTLNCGPMERRKQMENRLIDVDTSRRKMNAMPPSKCLLQLKSHDCLRNIPLAIHPPANLRHLHLAGLISTLLEFERPRRQDLGPLGSPVRQSNCFFPRDEDDEESGPAPQHKSPVSPQIPSEVPAKRTRDEGTTDRDEDFRGSGLSRPLPFQHVPGPRETVPKTKSLAPQPMHVPPSSVRDSLKTSLAPKPVGGGDVSISPIQQSHIVEPEAEGTPRPSSPSGTTCKDLYAIVSQVGEGTFGKVYKARNVITNVHVALKRIRMEAEKDGFPVTAMREIKLLQSLRHQNVVRLYEMMVSNGSVYMVFEYMDHDLTGVLSQTQFSFSEANLKSLCSQMLAGLAYLHHKGVIHRDIKGSNILINNRGELKLADFGLARFYQKRRRSDYTNRVITLWYRPPELLFGATVYGPEVDMWSAGCIMLELFTKKPVFQGNDEIHQLDVIYRILGLLLLSDGQGSPHCHGMSW